MNKSFTYMAMAAIALSSCAKNEIYENPSKGIHDPNKISFNSSTGNTRAVSNDLAALKGSADGFNVMGFKKDASVLIPGTDTKGTYKFTTPTWGWDGNSYNWPDVQSEYPITFYAEYPKVDMSANSSLNKDITMDLAMANQVDYLIAKTVTPDKPNNGFAALNFKHILSNLVFKIATKDQYKVVIQSIRVVNTAKSGRTFDYATMAYEGTEPTYQSANYATTNGTYKEGEGFFYFKHASIPWEFTGDTSTGLIGTVTPEDGADKLMMQMPQLTIPYWTESNTTNGLGKFKDDVEAWKNAGSNLDNWYTGTVGGNPAGMSGSDGWEGARIEVIYRIYDVQNSKSIIGRQNGETYTNATGASVTADKDLFIRVGYPLDLSTIQDATQNILGWEMNKRYTYTIQMGTARATNGILLDPDYKGADGETSDNPKKPVDNPSVDPGNPTTPGTINFTVGVEDWADVNSGTNIN